MLRMPRWVKLAIRLAVFGLFAFAAYRLAFHWRGIVYGRLFPSFLLWLGFTVYWSYEGKNSAPVKTAESAKSQGIHQLFTNLAIIVLFAPLPGLTRYFLPQPHYLVWVGFAIQATFLLLAVWARRHLGRNWASAVRIGEGHELVKSGPYRILRHPIYTTIIGMYVGSVIASGEYHALLALTMIVFAYLRKSSMEDAILSTAFGSQYDDYRRNTWALVPLVY